MFSGSRSPTALLWIMSGVRGAQKSKMAAAIPEVPITRLVDKIATQFQRLIPCFRGPDIIHNKTVGILDPENMGLAVEIVFLSGLQAEK